MKITGYQISLSMPGPDYLHWKVDIIMDARDGRREYVVSVERDYGETGVRVISFPVENREILKPYVIDICHNNKRISETLLIYRNLFKKIPKADEFYKMACDVAGPVLKKHIDPDYSQIQLINIHNQECRKLSEVFCHEDLMKDMVEFRELLGKGELLYDHLVVPQ